MMNENTCTVDDGSYVVGWPNMEQAIDCNDPFQLTDRELCIHYSARCENLALPYVGVWIALLAWVDAH